MTAVMTNGFDAPSVDAIEREIVSGARRLVFSRPVEELYRNETRGERLRMFTICAIAAVILFDLYLANDWLTLQDVFAAMIVVRLAVFTPTIFVFLVIVYRTDSQIVREGLGVVSSILAVLLPMTIWSFSHSTHRLSYQFGTLLIMVFSSVIQRLPFRFAMVSMLGIMTIQCIATFVSGVMDGEVWTANVVFFSTAMVLLLLASYFLERADRLSFLFSLRARLLHAKLAEVACTDPLTLLYNRRHLVDVLASTWEAARGSPRVVSLLLLDIDHFKSFNDSYGHMLGDECLRRISRCVATVAEVERGLAFRFGGEEILVLLLDRSLAEAGVIAERIRATIEAASIAHPVLGEGAVVTASFGVASAVAPETIADVVTAAADAALYAAKRAGRNCIWPPLKPITATKPNRPPGAREREADLPIAL